jgi:hypothetical protein
LGCEGIILPSPMTTVTSHQYEVETKWLDIGAAVCRELRVSVPVYASVALADNVLRGVNPFKNPLLNIITSQIASRDEIAGAYFVVEQTAETGYSCTSRDVLAGMLVMADDLTRGAGRRVIANYIGTFGAVMSAAGTSIWASGYYRSQRRLRLSDYEENIGSARPRYFSFGFAGDVGLEKNLADAYSRGLGRRLLDPLTELSKPLDRALAAGTYPATVPQWAYTPNNLTAATAHYLTVNDGIARTLDVLDGERRIEQVHRWLKRATLLASDLAALGMKPPQTDSTHQAAWLGAYEDWLNGRS